MDQDAQSEIIEQSGESPNPPKGPTKGHCWDYDAWGTDSDGNIYHSLYGVWWERSTLYSKLDIELECFRVGRSEEDGGLGKYGHLRECVELLWRTDANGKPLKNPKVEWNEWVDKMLEEACGHQFLSVAGCSSSCKSFSGAIYGICTFLSWPSETSVLITSTSIQGAKKRIWKAVIELWNALPDRVKKDYKIRSSLNMIQHVPPDGSIPSDSASINLIAAEPKQEAGAMGKLIGIKGKQVLLIADELCELSPAVLAATTNLMSNSSFQMIAMSNPKDYEDPFGKMSEPVDGWNSIDESSFEWETKYGKAIRFDVLQSPNYLSKKKVYPYMLSYQAIEKERKKHGENSPMFYRFFRGFWPIQGVENVLYSEVDFNAYMKAGPVEWGKDAPIKVAGLDPAWSSKGDRSIFMWALLGRNKDGLMCLQYVNHTALVENASDKTTPFTIQTRLQVEELLKREGIHPSNFAFDNTGGIAYGDMLVQSIGRDVVRVNFAGKASERPVSSTDRTPASKKYVNRVSELWGVGIEFLRGGQLANIPDDLKAEMKSRRYETVKGGDGERMLMESKSEMRNRTGKSPDIADCLFIILDLCRTRHNFYSEERGIHVIPEKDIDKIYREMDIVGLSAPGGFGDWVPLSA